MNSLLEALRDGIMGLCIGVLFPLTVYLGLQLVMPNPGYKSFEIEVKNDFKDVLEKDLYEQALKDSASAKHEHLVKTAHYRNVSFYLFLLTGVAALVSGSFILIDALSLGLVAAGFIHLLVAWTYMPENPLLNFVFFFGALAALIVLGFIKSTKPQVRRRR